MTKRGHFILNGAARVIVNQIIRSPGIYYQEKKLPLYANEKDEKPFATLKRYYADFICARSGSGSDGEFRGQSFVRDCRDAASRVDA